MFMVENHKRSSILCSSYLALEVTIILQTPCKNYLQVETKVNNFHKVSTVLQEFLERLKEAENSYLNSNF